MWCRTPDKEEQDPPGGLERPSLVSFRSSAIMETPKCWLSWALVTQEGASGKTIELPLKFDFWVDVTEGMVSPWRQLTGFTLEWFFTPHMSLKLQHSDSVKFLSEKQLHKILQLMTNENTLLYISLRCSKLVQIFKFTPDSAVFYHFVGLVKTIVTKFWHVD